MEVFWTILAALVVGASLGLAGAVMQSVLRNPLAEPYLFGMVGGGTLVMVLALDLGLAAWGSLVLPAASLLGALGALGLVALIAWRAACVRRRDGTDPQARATHATTVLAGWAVGGTLGSLEIVALAYATPENQAAVMRWLFGSLATLRPAGVVAGAVVFVLAFAATLACRRSLAVMELGHDEAECLGVNARGVGALVLTAVALATSVAVALAGAIGFVGLVVPHVVRRLCGARMTCVLTLSALGGGLFVLAAEGVARALPPTTDGTPIGVGVVCAVLGGPAFLLLLAARRNGEGRDV